MPSELHQIRQIFDNFQMPLSMEWLESCIEWCKQDNLPANYTLKHLQNMVYEQWLILDLRDVEISSLPANLNSEKKYSLTGVYYLQLLQVIDISKPKLWQIQRIRNKVGKNTEIERDFGKRVLQLTLTDGVQEVQAMEFKAVSCLSINSPPGTKLKIIGPVLIRNGRIMLESENVRNLGGSVDDLLVSNAAENVLARALGLEENPTPQTIDEKILDVSEDSNTQGNISASRQQFNVPVDNMPQNQTDRNTVAARNGRTDSVSNQRNITTNNGKIRSKFGVDDKLMRKLQEDFGTSLGDFKSSVTCSTSMSSIVNSHSKIPNSKSECLSPDLFEEMEFEDDVLNKHLNEIDIPSISNQHKVAKVSKTNEVNQRNVNDIEFLKTNAEENVIVLDDSFDDIDIDTHLDHLDEKMASLPCSTQVKQDLKKNVHSPELKRPKKGSSAAASSSKKLLQSKLAFGLSASNRAESRFSNSNSNLNDMVDVESTLKNPESFVTPPVSLALSKNKSNVQSSSREIEDTFSNKSKHLQPPDVPNNKAAFDPSPVRTKLNIISIQKLNSLLPNVSKGKFKIRGKFKKVKEKLRTTANSLYLAIMVEDDSGEVAVEVHSSIATRFAQITLERLEELRQLSLKSDEHAKPEIMQALRKLHRKLLALDNILELQVTRGEKYPVVVSVLENS